jgi:hypothetical protein
MSKMSLDINHHQPGAHTPHFSKQNSSSSANVRRLLAAVERPKNILRPPP